MNYENEPKSKVLMILLAFFLGGLGIHRLKMGYPNWWIYPLTFGGLMGILPLYDIVQILLGNLVMADGRPLS